MTIFIFGVFLAYNELNWWYFILQLFCDICLFMKYCDLSLTWFMCDQGEFKGRRREEGEKGLGDSLKKTGGFQASRFRFSYAATHLVPYCSDEHLTSWHSWSGLQPGPPPNDSYTHFNGQARSLVSRVPPMMFFNSFLLNLAVLFNFRDFIIFSFELIYTQWTPYSSSGPAQRNGTQSILLGQPSISMPPGCW